MADPTRFERATFAFGGRRSIQLSYGSLNYIYPRRSWVCRAMRDGPAEHRGLFSFVYLINGWLASISNKSPVSTASLPTH